MSKDIMQDLASHIEETIGRDYGFVLMIFEVGKLGRMNYVSNSNRADVVEALKEFIQLTEDSWGAHRP